MNTYVDLSVHDLVDFVLRRGSIDSRSFNNDTMLEGSRLHLRYQGLQDGTYQKEVPLEGTIKFGEYIFHLHGRADGIIHGKEFDIIDEIKTCNIDIEEFFALHGEWHLGQAVCYAYLLAKDKYYRYVGVKLTYISQINDDEDEQVKKQRIIKSFNFSYDELESRVFKIISEYLDFYRQIEKFHQERNKSAETLKFPFSTYRHGQKEIAKYVYQVARNGGNFFLEAPTGIGKTMSTIFPAIKTYIDDVNQKIFYLTAKVQARIVAENAIDILLKNGLFLHSITLSSKEHMCQKDERRCNPDECPFAVNYYSKIKNLITKLLIKEQNLTADKILKFAIEHQICPFEFELDLSLYCDFIICDYNYLFDPLVYLKRFFDEGKTNYFALIDESHNLSERTKEMYTAEISFLLLEKFKMQLKKTKFVSLKRRLKNLMNYITLTAVNENDIYHNDFPQDFYFLVENLLDAIQKIMKDEEDTIEDIYFDVFRMCNRFLKIHEYLNDDFVCYSENKDDLKFIIRCLNAASLIKIALSKLRGAVFFSATLAPIDYYIKTLGGDDNAPFLRLDSPFDSNRLLLLVQDNISTKYQSRDDSYLDIASSIKTFVNGKIGNYLVFFSSYAYLQNVLNYYRIDDEEILVQERDMNIIQRSNFLSKFVENPTRSVVGFAVLGGSFSEGIDLVSSRLIGAVIVGVGLPMVSFERNLIKEYYNKHQVSGFDYAYTNPGKNKVMQAAGRVIRTSSDIGAVLLIDERFSQRKYRDLFHGHFSHPKIVRSVDEIANQCEQFWKKFSC